MRWVLIAVAALVVPVVVVIVVGYLLPRDHVAQVRRHQPAAPEAVWSVITDVDRFSAWRTDLVGVERVNTADGKLRWKERAKHDAITFELVESDRPRRLVTRIADEGLPFGGSWTYELVPDADGTMLTITENGSVYNPVFRFVSRFVMGHTATMEKFQAALSAALSSRTAAVNR